MSASGDGKIHEKHLSPAEEPLLKKNEKPTDTQEVVSGARKRKKGKQMRQEGSKRFLKAFIRAYEYWNKIQRAKESRTRDSTRRRILIKYTTRFKMDMTVQPKIMSHSNVILLTLQTRKMDACNTPTTEVCDLASK